jgi:hypothetical protein
MLSVQTYFLSSNLVHIYHHPYSTISQVIYDLIKNTSKTYTFGILLLLYLSSVRYIAEDLSSYTENWVAIVVVTCVFGLSSY